VAAEAVLEVTADWGLDWTRPRSFTNSTSGSVFSRLVAVVQSVSLRSVLKKKWSDARATATRNFSILDEGQQD